MLGTKFQYSERGGRAHRYEPSLQPPNRTLYRWFLLTARDAHVFSSATKSSLLMATSLCLTLFFLGHTLWKCVCVCVHYTQVGNVWQPDAIELLQELLSKREVDIHIMVSGL